MFKLCIAIVWSIVVSKTGEILTLTQVEGDDEDKQLGVEGKTPPSLSLLWRD